MTFNIRESEQKQEPRIAEPITILSQMGLANEALGNLEKLVVVLGDRLSLITVAVDPLPDTTAKEVELDLTTTGLGPVERSPLYEEIKHHTHRLNRVTQEVASILSRLDLPSSGFDD